MLPCAKSVAPILGEPGRNYNRSSRYASDAQHARLLRREVGTSHVGLTASDAPSSLFVAAVAHFRSEGMVGVTCLSERYEPDACIREAR
jgi:hypothetical protein